MVNFAEINKHNIVLDIFENLLITKFRSLKVFSRVIRIAVIVAAFGLAVTSCEKDRSGIDSKEQMISAMLEDISADSLIAHVKWLQGMGTRFAFSPNTRIVANKILSKFKAMGYENARLDSFLVSRNYRDQYYSIMQYNVLAELEGSENPDSVCILGAHYDDIVRTGDPFTFAPGAHDNASGTAATIEVARVMKKNNYQPSKTILFIAFGAEELGLLGSYDFTSNLGEYSKIAFMINNDMIAYETSQNPDSWIVNILDYDNSHDLRKFAEKVTTNRTELLYTNDNYYNRYSDSWPFAQRGIKAIFFSSVDNDPFYHTNEDIWGNLNYGYCREITRASCGILMERN